MNHRVPLADLLLTSISVTLLAILLFIFWQEWRRTRARFSLGLVLFAGVFFVKELFRVLIVLDRGGDIPIVGPQLGMLVNVAQVVALATLLYIVSR